MTGVNECSQQRGNLKDDGYISVLTFEHNIALIPHMSSTEFDEKCRNSLSPQLADKRLRIVTRRIN
ncbi:hypothetical protein GPY37_04210 [Photorhabdus kayaii]|uniref:Uncharacterized protein n=2 Tax=Photorhabdus TaxID=29487 RepID=A0ABX0AZX0_9GAMM|nr:MULTISPECIES: hypothetical protein [Photorhabdus]MCC8373020.1 hypothetical protein [Photorhabdus bodei]MDB6367929.1 hypothetical protein [Photorhabdus bodei]MDB6371751.1 hypothetical protein [Photorhabdus bodei]NDL11001.1 hypothetical protein [Photorhabdus kayaii]NDL24528.1 hypothetical protein [Photorhabdus kayaii]